MQTILDWLFRDDETLHPKVVIGAGLLAYVLMYLNTWLGIGIILAVPLVVISITIVCYAVLRFLLPMMDPRDPDADRFAVWGGTLLFVIVGADAFGVWFIPGLVLGGGLLYWRAPELLEVFPYFEGKGGGMER